MFFLVLSLFTFSLVALALFSPGPVMGDSVADSVAGKVPKRTALGGAGNPSKQLLQSNVFSPLPLDDAGNPPKKRKKQQSQLPQVQPERKEKCPPVFVKGDPPDLRPKIRQLIAKGLKCTTTDHHQSVVEFLEVHKYEYYTHDHPGTKPLKALLRGLHDMSTTLKQSLKAAN